MPEEFTKLPKHIAIIMDGNGRWAKARGLPRIEGHRAGTETLRRVIRACVEFKVSYLTVYAFSTENWARPKDEVSGLMMLLESVVEDELDELNEEGVCIRHIGRLEAMPAGLRKKVKHAIEVTRDNTRLFLTIAWNYGGRDEIIHAVQQMLAEGVKPEEVNEEMFGNYLFTAGTPDPDLIIRTSGELRLSNFLIWQSAYAEWVVSSGYWPDYDKEELRQAILEFGRRDRRYGKVSSDNKNG